MSGITAIVAHDAGGAEILSSAVRRLPPPQQHDFVFSLAGPALKVFARKLPQVQPIALEEAVAQAGRLLCGTGWQSELELRAIELARAQGKSSVAFLDHWINYRERFVRGDRTVLPDEVWVGDSIALQRASTALPELPVLLVENPYFLDLREQLAAASPPADEEGLSVLFLCEPVREHALRQHGDPRYWGYTEEDALRWFLGHLDALPRPVKQVVVRPHPAEAAGKYDELLARYRRPIRLSTAPDVLDDMVASDWVAGCNSMAMVIALIARRQVLCCIPPGGRPCVLPQPEIVHLQDLLREGRS